MPNDIRQVFELYNSICSSFPKIRALSETRRKAIKARLRTYSIDDFRVLFEKAEASNFLRGKNNRDWSATFDWLIKDSNMVKVLEGNYDNKDPSTDDGFNYDIFNRNTQGITEDDSDYI